MGMGLRVCALGMVAVLVASSARAEELTFAWTGVLENVAYGGDVQPPSTFAGIPVGTLSSGTMRYDDAPCAAGCPATGAQRSDFVFPSSSAALQLGALSLIHPTPQSNFRVVVFNDATIPSGLRPFLSALAGVPVTAETLYDGWSIASQDLRAFDDAPSFGITYVSFDTALYSDTSYRRAPDPSQADLIYFFAADGAFLNVYFAGGRTDIDGDLVPNRTDNCPRAVNPDQANGDGNPRGNACLCGDQSRDGQVSVNDIVAANTAIFDPRLVTPLCDANGDGFCNVTDLVGINLEIFSPGETATCALQPCPGIALVCP